MGLKEEENICGWEGKMVGSRGGGKQSTLHALVKFSIKERVKDKYGPLHQEKITKLFQKKYTCHKYACHRSLNCVDISKTASY